MAPVQPYTMQQQLRHWSRKGCGFLAVRYLEVKLYRSDPSVIVNWEVVRSSEVLSLWQIQFVPWRLSVIIVGGRAWEGPL